MLLYQSFFVFDLRDGRFCVIFMSVDPNALAPGRHYTSIESEDIVV